jgi:MFS family permease
LIGNELSDTKGNVDRELVVKARTRLRMLLYLVCGLTDFAAFSVVFTVSRNLADGHAEPWILGLMGAGRSFAAALGSIGGGWLASRVGARGVFVSGVLALVLSIVACLAADLGSLWFVPGYWLSGIGLGLLYPPLIGWLNQGDDAHANRQGVSGRLIVFCVAWNVGMIGGQIGGGSLYQFGIRWPLAMALAVAVSNLIAAGVVAGWVRRLPAIPAEAEERVHAAAAVAAAYKRLSWIANLGGVFGASLVIDLLPDVVVNLGIASEAHGWMLASWRAVVIATYLLMHYVGFWHYRMTVSLASQVLGAAGLVVIAQAESAAMLFVGLALLGQLVGFNYFSGLYYSTAGSSDEGRTLAAGIHEATLATGMALGTVVGGVSGSLINHRMPYLLAAAVIVMLIAAQSAAWWYWVRPLGRR